jgi:hypothetical protein
MSKNPYKIVPKNTYYCYTLLRKAKNGNLIIKPCEYYTLRGIDGAKKGYCKLLRDYLTVDDMVKDCEIFLPDYKE